MTEPLRTRLASGKPQFGCWLSLTSPFSAEALSQSGFAFLVVDMEHSPADIAWLMSGARQVLAAVRAP